MASRRLRAFISSRMEELALERQAIRSALAEMHVEAFAFEKDAGARPYSIQQTYLEELEAVNLYIGVFWKGYGQYTIEEYEHAQALGMDCLIYEKRAEVGTGRDPDLQAFLNRISQVETGVTVRWFHTPEELGQFVKEDVSGWQFRIVEEATRAGSPTVYQGVPSNPLADFVGRGQEMERLVRELRAGKDLAVEGLPGVGKTTLAVAVAHLPGIRRHFKAGTLWASLGLNADVASTLMSWASALERAGILKEDISQLPGLGERAQVLRNAIGQRRLLLVLDDVWDIDAATTLRCGGPNCCHLMTTRDKGIARAFAGLASAECLTTLNEMEALELLQRLAPEACGSDPQAALALVRGVGGLPLALRLIGGYLSEADSSLFADVFTSLNTEAFAEMTQPRKRLQLAGQRLGTLSGEKVALGETIALSLDGLPEPTQSAFYRLGVFAPKPERFSPEAAEAVTAADARSLSLLAARNLLEVDRASRRLSLHPIVADVARTGLEQAAVTRHREHYLTFAHQNAGQWQRVEEVYGQIRWAWQHAADDETLFAFLGILEDFQGKRGLSSETLAWAQRALGVAQSRDLKSATARLHMMMAGAHGRMGYRRKALDLYEVALAVWEELEQRAWTVQTLLHISHAHGRLGQPDEALRLLDKALALAQAGNDRAEQAEIHLLFGLIYRDDSRPAKAVKYVTQALQIYRELGNRSGEVDALGMLGTLYRNLGQPDQALEQVRQALAISEDLGNPASQAEMRMVTASVYRRQGRLEEALATAEGALKRAETTGDRELLFENFCTLGGLHLRLQQPEKALECHRQALAIAEEADNRGSQAIALRDLGWLHREQKRYELALEAYQQATALWDELGNEGKKATAMRDMRLVRYDRQFGKNILDRLPFVTPLEVAAGVEPASRFQDEAGKFRDRLRERIAAMADRIYASMGVSLPEVTIRTDLAYLKPGQYLILLDEVPLAGETLPADSAFYPGPPEDLVSLGIPGEKTVNPQTGEAAVWIAREYWKVMEASGKRLWDVTEYFARHLETVIRRNLSEFVGHQETINMLEAVLPGIAGRMRDNSADLSLLVTILRNLLEESVPLVSFRTIVEEFVRLREGGAERLDILRSIRCLPEVRPCLPGNDDACSFYRLGARLEEKVAGAIQIVDSDAYLAMEPADTQHSLKRVRETIAAHPDLRHVAVLVQNTVIRRFVRKLVELEFPCLFVLSREELLSGLEARIVDEIEW